MEQECGVARRADCSARGGHYGATAGNLFALPGHGDAAEHPLLKRRHAHTELLFGAYLPFVLAIGVVACFTFASAVLPWLPWLVTFISADVLLAGNWPTTGRGPFGKALARDWMPFVLASLTLLCAVMIGRWNMQVIEPWVAHTWFPAHSDVSPVDLGAAFGDAGALYFEEGTELDGESAAGFQVWPDVYCAAPILDEFGGGPLDLDPVTFWAIGRNCCKSRGGFTCDDAGDPAVRSGLHAVAQQGDPNYLRAVRMAAAVNDLVVPDEPIFVHWVKKPPAAAKRSLLLAIVVLGCTTLGSVILCVAFHFLFWKVLGLSLRRPPLPLAHQRPGPPEPVRLP